MERWVGRVAVVTGASVGIGASIAEELVKKGLKVVGLARRVEKVEELAEKLSSQPGKLFPLKCDITVGDEREKAFGWIKSNLGGVDILINNAGVSRFNTLSDGPEENWKHILDLNVLALSSCTRLALQSMKERNVDDGHIIHINSQLGHTVPRIELSVYMYSASKHAVTVLTEGLRRELVNEKSKIRVTSISPGLVRSEMTEHLLEVSSHLEPKDIAEAVLYALGAPVHVQVHDLIITHVAQMEIN